MEGTGASIGNYKAVMLCSRPFAGVSAAGKKAFNEAKGSSARPFLSSCSGAEPLGLNPIRHPPNVVVDRSKKDTALSKHKKWLSELKKQKKQVEEDMAEHAREKQEKMETMKERLRQQREKVVKERRGEEYNSGGVVEYEENPEAEEKYEENPEAEEKYGERDALFTEEKQKEKRELEKKPAWALSRDDVDKLEDLETDELLDFADGLDFDSFLDDLETRSTAPKKSNQKCRTKNCDGDQEDDRLDLDETASEGKSSSGETGLTAFYEYLGVEGEAPKIRAAIRETYKKKKAARKEIGGWNSSIKPISEEKQEDFDDCASIASAKSILSHTSVRSLKQIHSARSLAKVAERISKEIDTDSLGIIEEERDLSESKIEPPRIVSVYEDGRTRLTNKEETYNLPYMHRNPAV